MVNSLLISNGSAFSKSNVLSDAHSVDQGHVSKNLKTNRNVDVNVMKSSSKKDKIILLPLPPKASKGGYIDFDAKTYEKYRHHHNTTATSKYEAMIPMLNNMNFTQRYHYHHAPEVHFGKNTPLWRIRFPNAPSAANDRLSSNNDVDDTEAPSQINSTSVRVSDTNAKSKNGNAPRGTISVASFLFFSGCLFAHRLKKKRRNAQNLEDMEGDFYYFYGTEGLEVPSEADYGSFASPWISDLHKFDV